MIVLHKLLSDGVANLLARGLRQDNGDDEDIDIARADAFLDGLRPEVIVRQGISRRTSTYCYLLDGNSVIDITSGERKAPREVLEPDETLLRIQVDPGRSFVSNLDLYDEVMELLLVGNVVKAEVVAHRYWQQMQLLAIYDETIRRPEVMVTYDVPPSHISMFEL